MNEEIPREFMWLRVRLRVVNGRKAPPPPAAWQMLPGIFCRINVTFIGAAPLFLSVMAG
jgi:hypothetical protein